MHMADALLSPPVGGAMLAATAVTMVYCARKVREELDESKVPLMGVAGAFVFAAQMLNFAIPGTGSSGHIGGGLLLAAVLGPHAAFLVMASVLGVQALFFADGGLLALGANVFNLGFFPAFVAYLLVYRRIAGDTPTPRRITVASVIGAIVGLQLGALGVVLQTVLSGVSELPLGAFLAMMLPIHLAIGLIEGLVTAGVILFVYKAQPEILASAALGKRLSGVSIKSVLAGLLVAAVVAGAALSWFASANPDGLEWAIERVAGTGEIDGATAETHQRLAGIQERTSFLPDYGFRTGGGTEVDARDSDEAGPVVVDAGTTTAGIIGGAITLAFAVGAGLLLRRRA